ncbi:hypothetical protein [Chitinophaga varians]|uniref:hypothetical protein n=1 Tax=Chitinophaga varians TaxID=2202339 RepID=UPI00165F0E1B|nr:hypothetical protein [Chitinophaga varians]MBC9913136.1 hypothetical protein [Chitinophaga varians]
MTPTPKEKAQELCDKLGKYLRYQEWKKSVALMWVDEIIKAKPIGNSLEYWQQVKEEIQKM